MLVVWTLDRLGRTLAHLVNTVQDLSARGVGRRVLTGQGAQIDTTTAADRLMFGIFAALAEFERELIPRTHPGRAHGRASRSPARGGALRLGLLSSSARQQRHVTHPPVGVPQLSNMAASDGMRCG